MSDRALAACREYVRWQNEIRRLSEDIGGNLNLCHLQRNEDQAASSEALPLRAAVNETHLKIAYTPEINHDAIFPERDYLSPDEVVEYLTASGCKYCLQAHHLIQKRKVARQKFGAAKRWIARIGKAIPKGGA
jgi:hypothetical protein